MDGIQALDLWNLVVEVFHYSQIQSKKPRIHWHRETCDIASCQAIERRIKPKLQPSTTVLIFQIENVFRTSNFLSPLRLYVLEDNEAVIKIVIEGRSPTMGHVSRTHRVSLDWLCDRISLDPKIEFRYIHTKHQIADIH